MGGGHPWSFFAAKKDGVAATNVLFNNRCWCFNEIARGIFGCSDRGYVAPLGVAALMQEAVWMQ